MDFPGRQDGGDAGVGGVTLGCSERQGHVGVSGFLLLLLISNA